jgi:hypothetical protein
MKRLILLLSLLAAPAAAQPHAWLVPAEDGLPPNPDQPSHGSFSRAITPPASDRLGWLREESQRDADRTFQRELADRLAPRTEIRIERRTVIIHRFDRRGHDRR